MKTFALTGNIGSGKTSIANVFKILGASVYNADTAGHFILQKKEVINEILNVFGNEILTDNNIDRKKLADIVFNNASALEKLNAIIHPKVLEDFKLFILQNKNTPYTIFESALIFESHLESLFDETILVFAPLELKIKRVAKRDECTNEKVIARLSKQIPDDLKLDKASYIITNDERELVIPQVIKLDKLLRKN